MKKIIYILFTFHLSLLTIYAQWYQQYTASSNLLDVSFVNQNTGWASGDGGLIIKTTNGGINWTAQMSGIINRLEGIHAVDSQFVYAVGWFQTILKTTNGGNNWMIIRNGIFGSDPSFFGLYFLNRNTGWMLRNEYVLRTVDGCNTFDSTHINFSYLRDVFFKDASTGVMCTDAAGIFKSTDGGVTWNFITIPLAFEAPDFYKESFIGNTGWVVGAGTNVPGMGPLTWRTTNFGTTWDTIGRVPYPYTHLNYCVFFSSINTGWCGGSYGHVYKTTNSGFNWVEENTQAGTGFVQSMWFYNDSVGWGVGGGGKIIHTTNSGMPVAITQPGNKIPKNFKLMQNYPNPFNSQTTIEFSLPGEGIYKMELYNEIGQLVKEIFNENIKRGNYKISLDASELSSGIYFYVLSSGDIRQSKKLIIIK
jgi:photosystem II stability/assembly factor-like uncharacterized protein